MKKVVVLLVLALSLHVSAEDKKPTTLRGILLEQLHTTHNQQDWFVTINSAVDGLTAEQASWQPKAGEHSVGQLANHILFWNKRILAKWKGMPEEKFSGNNDETFNNFDAKRWADTVKQLDQVMTECEKIVETVDEKKLEELAPTIARMGTHNAYHTGQIITVRKLQGSWNPEKGVK